MRVSSSRQMSLLNGAQNGRETDHNAEDAWLQDYLETARLNNTASTYEDWVIEGSSAELSYLTHGAFRYFGKFPPPVATRFIRELHDPSCGPVIDPMVGSGTTLVEAIALERDAIGLDASPLSCLVSKVKTTPVKADSLAGALGLYLEYMKLPTRPGVEKYVLKDSYLDHWFYAETQQELAQTRQFIEEVLTDTDVQDVFRVVLAGIVRRVSRASNGLGRMFLDPAIPVLDTAQQFATKATQVFKGISTLQVGGHAPQVIQHDSREPFLKGTATNLAICHPPYFNVYRYSSIYKYELLWLGYNYSATRKLEVRDGFKIGKPELVHEYVSDMSRVLENVSQLLVAGGWCVLMIGDTYLRGERINTTALLLDKLQQTASGLEVERVIVRHPKYTEASYAATQRRSGKEIGVKLPDHIVVFRKVTANHEEG